MSIKQVTPNEAAEALNKNSEARYIDVRSILEFEQGHAVGAYNIPIMHMEPGVGMTPNPDFADVAQKNIPKQTELYVGCKMGGRSQRACELLAMLGYENLNNIDGGFSGNDHQAGWEAEGLPIERETETGHSYQELK